MSEEIVKLDLEIDVIVQKIRLLENELNIKITRLHDLKRIKRDES